MMSLLKRSVGLIGLSVLYLLGMESGSEQINRCTLYADQQSAYVRGPECLRI